MKKYDVHFVDFHPRTAGPYSSYEFRAKDDYTIEWRWVEVRISDTLKRILNITETKALIPLAAKAVQLYLQGKLPTESFREEEPVVITLTSDWYPNSGGRPETLQSFQHFKVVDRQDSDKKVSGDYDLLPHQEDLMREIVQAYEVGGYPHTFFVSRHDEGAEIYWEGGPSLSYDQRTLWEDLHHIASQGLLSLIESDQHIRTYMITRASLDAVANDFLQRSLTSPQVPQPAATAPHLDFSFITSADDRALIERDYEEATKVFAAGANKSAIILSGSIAEAILLERLSHDEPSAKAEAATLKIRHQKDPLDEWDLSELVKVAEAMGILGADAKNLADQLRNYRNVIHPGVEKRKGFEPSPGKARAALALLELIVEALS